MDRREPGEGMRFTKPPTRLVTPPKELVIRINNDETVQMCNHTAEMSQSLKDNCHTLKNMGTIAPVVQLQSVYRNYAKRHYGLCSLACLLSRREKQRALFETMATRLLDKDEHDL